MTIASSFLPGIITMHLRPDKKILLQINSIKISYNYIISYTPPPPSTAYLPNEKTHIHVKFGICLLQYCLYTHLALFVHACMTNLSINTKFCHCYSINMLTQIYQYIVSKFTTLRKNSKLIFFLMLT